ncbi:hypothetical protein [Paracoccus albus]|uniref:hypothetical protein n=1 Tax=Paracoccus albus TaxID=3017784 RepID=UPI0022F0028E|nr:hypothetical protein [Paracoccus albus]WBU59143.1 hypothetical protein PAF20_10070 [Paracoccus albus]
MQKFIIAATAVFLTVGAASAQAVFGTGSWSGSESGAAFSGQTSAGTVLNGVASATNTTEMAMGSTGSAVGYTGLGFGGAISGSASGTTVNGGVKNESTGGSLGFGASSASGTYGGTNGSNAGAFGGFGFKFP